MTEYGFPDPRLIVLFSMTFMGYLASPGIAANLWQGIKDNRTLHKAKKLSRKKREREKRAKKYWEIDMRNFK